MKIAPLLESIERKMKAAGLPEPAIRTFKRHFGRSCGQPQILPESDLEPVSDRDLHSADAILREHRADPALLRQTVVLKLNGGLGTSMGLESAKSLIQVKGGRTFLDFIVQQIESLRALAGDARGRAPRLILMNSFSTSPGVMDYLKRRHPALARETDLELIQNQIPKLRLSPNSEPIGPVEYGPDSQLEWCPPGHGDVYPTLLNSGVLDRLLEQGFRHLFVSNSDNLGATLDPVILAFFASSGVPFLMEVTHRTPADRKGGHLARHRGSRKLVLRETAQCDSGDATAFQDIERHRFFNTNNVWIDLQALREQMRRHDDHLPLPVFMNLKNVNPRDPNSERVFQMETALGSAIETFENAGALIVSRERFSPVKTTSDLFALRSDAYETTEDGRVVLADREVPPLLELDPRWYARLDQLESLTPEGVPSLRRCSRLTVLGPVLFSASTTIRGEVEIRCEASQRVRLPPGDYADRTVTLPLL